MSITVLTLTPSRFVARSFQNAFRNLRWSAPVVTAAREARSALEKIRPDVVIIDPEFSEISGADLCKEVVQAVQGLKDHPVPVIFYAKGTRDSIVEALKAGAADYVIKPASFATIFAKIERVLGRAGVVIDAGAEADEETAAPSIFKPEMTAQARVALVLGKAREVKTIPFTVSRALQITDDPTTGARDLSRVIQSDTAVAAMVLRRANSARYVTDRPIGDLTTAIVRIGFEETRSLVIGIRIIKTFGGESARAHFSRLGFWEHALAVGLFARELARQGKGCDPGYAFMGGLLHDVGKLLLDDHVPHGFQRACAFALRHGMSLACSEKQVLGITHNEVGEALMRLWQFPLELADVAACHNPVPGSTPEIHPASAGLCTLVSLANDMAKAFRVGCAGDETLGDVDQALAGRLAIDRGAATHLVEKVREEILDFKSFLRMGDQGGPSPDHAAAPSQLPTIRFMAMPSRPLSLFELYLANSGYRVEREDDPRAFAAGARRPGECAACVVDLGAAAEVDALADVLTAIPESIPFLILTPREPGERAPGRAVLLKKPIDGRLLSTAIDEALHEAEFSDLERVGAFRA